MLRGLTRALSPRRAALLAAPAAAAVGLHLAWARRPAACEPVEPLGGVEPAEAEPSEWNHVIAGTLPAVVSIRVNRVRAFDTATAGTAQATGFVVDVKNGFILTNRHVAGPGPIVADAVFQNNEEVPLQVVYMDPVHDFALLQFDPAAVKHMQLVEIPLAPHEAAVATEIAIIGNNAGEKCSISRTTLARLDRNAPAYNRNSYNDFNTFYFQASSSTSGGSSGSPVINRHGRAIAINAGGKIGTSAGFFLPLDRVKRALALVQAAAFVPRGSVCTVCLHQPFDEARRLGLPEELEACIRASSPSLSGLLVVAEVLPRGPADGKLQPGDILIEAAGKACTGFVGLEEALDSHVLRTVTLAVCRGGQLLHVDLDVADLHSLTPAHFFEFGGAVLNELSYQQARNHGIAVGGVYVAHPGYTLRQARISRGAIISSVNAVETPTLESFARVITAAPHGEKLTFRSHDIAHPEYVQLSAARMDRKWFPLSECRRRGHLSAWCTSRIASAVTPPREESAATASPPCDAATAPTAAAAAPPAPAAAAAAPPPAAKASEGAAAAEPLDEEAAQRRLASALVTVDFTRPFFIDGETGMRYRGTGLVLDAKLGLVAVDRNTVNTTLGDVFVTIGGRATVPANVAYVHPVHNFALVQFDPATVPADIHFTAAPVAPISRVTTMRTGAQVWLAGLKSGLNHEFDTSRRVDLVVRKTRLANSGWIKLPLPNPPRYQMYNCETFGLEVAPSMDGGAVADLSGDVVALWVSCAYQASQSQHAQVFRGLPIHLIDSVSRQLSRGEQPKPWRSLAVTFEPISVATARDLGVSDAEIAERGGADVPCVLCVAQVQNKSPAAAVLRGGDLVLRIDRQPVRSLYEAEAALEGRAAVALDVVRDGKELRLQCETTELHGAGTTQVVGWAGLMLQTVPEAVQAQRYVPPAGVYASYRFFGSPASRYDLPPTSHIVEVDSTPTPDLEAFLAITAHKQDGDVVRLKYVDIDGRSRMTTLKLDMTYWPTFVLQRTTQGDWARTEVQAAGCEPPVGASAS